MVNATLPLTILATLAVSATASNSSIANSTESRRLAKVAYTARGVDLPGFDVGQAKASRPEYCLAECRATPRCLVFTWTRYEGGTCYLKSAQAEPVISVGAESGILLEAVNGPTAQQYMGSFSDCDMPGFDLGQERGTLEQCDLRCWGNSKCKAFTWTNYLGGTCFFKSDVRECAPTKGAITYVMFNNFVGA